MRANNLAYPITTYAVGEHRSSDRANLRAAPTGRSYSFAVVGIMFATVSAVAIAFSPIRFEGPGRSTVGIPANDGWRNGLAKEGIPTVRPQISLQLDSLQSIDPGARRPHLRHESASAIRGGERAALHQSSVPPKPLQPAALAHVAALPSERSTAGNRFAASDAIGVPSPLSPSSNCVTTCAHSEGIQATEPQGIEGRGADLAHSPVALHLATASISGEDFPSANGLIESLPQEPIADAADGGVLLVGAQDPIVVEPTGLSSPPQTSVSSNGTPVEAQVAVNERDVAWPQASGIQQAIPVVHQTAEDGNADAENPKTAPAKVAIHLARMRDRYSEAATDEELLVARSQTVGELTRAGQAAESRISVPLTTEGAPKVIIHDDELVAINLGELISLFEARLDRPLFVWMRSSSAASKFVTAETLAAAGIKTNYDSASKQLVLTVAKE